MVMQIWFDVHSLAFERNNIVDEVPVIKFILS